MSLWLLAVLCLLPPFAMAAVGAARGEAASRLVGVQLVTAIASPILALMTFAFDQSAFIDLALCLSLLTVPGTLLMALFMGRWL